MLEFSIDENKDCAVTTDAACVEEFVIDLADALKGLFMGSAIIAAKECLAEVESARMKVVGADEEHVVSSAGEEFFKRLDGGYVIDDDCLIRLVQHSLLLFLKVGGYKAEGVKEKRLLWVSDQLPQVPSKVLSEYESKKGF